MVTTQEGFVKVCTTIGEDIHEKIVKHNKTADRPINMAAVMRNALIKAAEGIE